MASSDTQNSFDPQRYWENRISANWSLEGVGFRRMGQRFNEQAYRLRRERFDEVVTEYLPPLGGCRVLDIGSGTGFYIDAWRRLGVSDIVGMDLTEAAVEKLRSHFPDVEFLRSDISTAAAEPAPGSFDVVSAMDVMFHIVDSGRFSNALSNVATLLRAGGWFVWSDFFLHGWERVNGHVAWRSLYRIEELLDRAGLDVIARRPMFFWMNEPVDTSSRAVLWGWKGLMWAASRSEATAALAAGGLYRLDRTLTRRCKESPSTEIMVCRRRQ